ncbi:hypothetical protein [Microbacterium allomyrinae]|uniref:Uncharacterized protein n=1 Tax=Microbacterium allomyrinae TaxID=2830666 RepID=A0A9X1S3V4_9MICO|nr:hypothetical protein [Microbacterium allomyrinae]MCC2034121.1 hypothetical protein [Microbacterium allomyrinae]
MPDLAWLTPDTAKSQLNITVTQLGLDVAREECLSKRGLAITTTPPPSTSFAVGVVYQALANKQAASANSNDEMGGENSVRLYPFDRKIMAMLIVPDVDDDDPEHDHSRVRSLIG